MKVLAAPGLKCPKEGRTRVCISDKGAAVEVPNTQYYRSRVRDGSLVLQPDPSGPRPAPSKPAARLRGVPAPAKTVASPGAPAAAGPAAEAKPVAATPGASTAPDPKAEVKPNVKQ